jgi:hypothetical protein
MFKYQFSAQFENGFILKQPDDDKSIYESNRSSFYDVLVYSSKLNSFWLSDKDNLNKYTVDLIDGQIIIENGTNKVVIPNDLKLNNYRVIYFRRNVIETGMIGNNRYISCFILGWQANDDLNNNVQKTIEIY